MFLKSQHFFLSDTDLKNCNACNASVLHRCTIIPAGIYMLKVNNRYTSTRCEYKNKDNRTRIVALFRILKNEIKHVIGKNNPFCANVPFPFPWKKLENLWLKMG